MSRLTTYPSHAIDMVWRYVEPHLKRAIIQQDEYTPEEVRSNLRRAKSQLWASLNDDGQIEAALVTQIKKTADGRLYCLLQACGGDNLEGWSKYLPAVEEWARSKGCDEMRVYGRRGWAKVLGYEPTMTKLSKKLWQ